MPVEHEEIGYDRRWLKQLWAVGWPLSTLALVTAVGWVLGFVGAYHAGPWTGLLMIILGGTALLSALRVANRWAAHRGDLAELAQAPPRRPAPSWPSSLPSSRRWWISWAVITAGKAVASGYAMMWWWPVPVAIGLAALIWLWPLVIHAVFGTSHNSRAVAMLEDFIDSERLDRDAPSPGA